MEKDKEWLKQWIEEYESEVIKVIEKRKDESDGFITTLSRGKQSAIKRIKQKIDQLDEQVKPVVPEYMADFIKHRKGTDAYSFGYVIRVLVERDENKAIKREYDWIDANTELFAQAWLAFPNIEVEKEPLFYVPTGLNKRGLYESCLAKDHLGSIDVDWADETYFKSDKNAERYRFTEQEIRSMPKGEIYFKNFAVPVEEVQNDS